MTLALHNLNWIHIVVAAVTYYMLGALWFSPIAFGPFYDRALGFDRPPSWRPAARFYIGPLIGCFAAAIATAILVRATGCLSLSDALLLGLVAGIGYASAVSAVNAITPITPKPFMYGAVTGAYHAVGITLVAIIETVWR